MGNSKAGIMNNKYVTISLDEYFKYIDSEKYQKPTVAKNLLKYLKGRNQERKIAA